MAKEPQTDEAKTERFNMFMSPSEMAAIDEWAWENRIRSKSEAVRRLVQIGLAVERAEKYDAAPNAEMVFQSLVYLFQRLKLAWVAEKNPTAREWLETTLTEAAEAIVNTADFLNAVGAVFVSADRLRGGGKIETLIDEVSHIEKQFVDAISGRNPRG